MNCNRNSNIASQLCTTFASSHPRKKRIVDNRVCLLVKNGPCGKSAATPCSEPIKRHNYGDTRSCWMVKSTRHKTFGSQSNQSGKSIHYLNNNLADCCKQSQVLYFASASFCFFCLSRFLLFFNLVISLRC